MKNRVGFCDFNDRFYSNARSPLRSFGVFARYRAPISLHPKLCPQLNIWIARFHWSMFEFLARDFPKTFRTEHIAHSILLLYTLALVNTNTTLERFEGGQPVFKGVQGASAPLPQMKPCNTCSYCGQRRIDPLKGEEGMQLCTWAKFIRRLKIELVIWRHTGCYKLKVCVHVWQVQVYQYCTRVYHIQVMQSMISTLQLYGVTHPFL